MKKIILSLAMIAAGAASYAQTEAGSIMIGGTLGFGTSGGSTEISGTSTPADGSVDAPKTNTLTIAPSAAYFIQDNLAVGAGISFGNSSMTAKKYYDKTTGTTTTPGPGFTPGANDVAYDDKTTTSGFGINLFVNKFNDLNDKWKWYYGANLGFGTGGGKTTIIKETTPGSGAYTTSEIDAPKSTNIGLGANIGVTYFLTENWAFFGGLNNLLALNYTTTKSETDLNPGTSTVKTNNLSLTLATGSVTSGTVNFGVFYFLGK
jgi:hypothetical protein